MNSPMIPKVQVKATDSHPSVGSGYAPHGYEANRLRKSSF